VRLLWSGDVVGQNWGINPDRGGMTIYSAMAAPERAVDGSAPPTPSEPTGPASRVGNGRDEHAAPVAGQVPVTLTAGLDDALWVAVDGADVQQMAVRISAACEVLIRAQRPVHRGL
jgi:hypothetical protein